MPATTTETRVGLRRAGHRGDGAGDQGRRGNRKRILQVAVTTPPAAETPVKVESQPTRLKAKEEPGPRSPRRGFGRSRASRGSSARSARSGSQSRGTTPSSPRFRGRVPVRVCRPCIGEQCKTQDHHPQTGEVEGLNHPCQSPPPLPAGTPSNTASGWHKLSTTMLRISTSTQTPSLG